MKDLKQKLTSRKFWITVAVILGNLSVVLKTDDPKIGAVSIICATLSAIIYNLVEGLIDKSRNVDYDKIVTQIQELVKLGQGLFNKGNK